MGNSFRHGEDAQSNKRSPRDYSREIDVSDLPQAKPERSPLPWKESATLTSGNTVAVISTAIGERGDKLYSFSVGRLGKSQGRVSKFFKHKDLRDLTSLLSDIGVWIENDRATSGSQDDNS